jgi:predicted DsbA family dithiol-disulfide isomerase
LFDGQPVDIPGMLAKLKATADGLGLPFGIRTMTYNSRRAQELGKWAETQGKGEAFHLAVFKACFADGLNIAKLEVLIDIAQSCGLRGDETRQVLDGRPFENAVDDDWNRSRAMGITAAPTFLAGSNRLVGAHPYPALKRLVESAGVPKRTQS